VIVDLGTGGVAGGGKRSQHLLSQENGAGTCGRIVKGNEGSGGTGEPELQTHTERVLSLFFTRKNDRKAQGKQIPKPAEVKPQTYLKSVKPAAAIQESGLGMGRTRTELEGKKGKRFPLVACEVTGVLMEEENIQVREQGIRLGGARGSHVSRSHLLWGRTVSDEK